VSVIPKAALLLLAGISLLAQPKGTPKWSAKNPPKFEDYPVTEVWHGTPAPVKLMGPGDRMFRTRIRNGAKEPPNFAAHYRLVMWGCGSDCTTGVLVDLKTGEIFGHPEGASEPGTICAPGLEGSDIDFHLDSRLIIVSCGLHYSERLDKNFPDVEYFLWDNNRFRRILFIPGKPPAQ
jgi:hypothetical protein